MIDSRMVLAGALLAATGVAQAEVRVTPAVVSDYDFRGISLSARDPALQLDVNYATASGFYAGLWGSNLDFGPGDPNVQVDAYAGFAGGDAGAGIGWDLGAVYSTFITESDFNFPELYAGLAKGPFSVKLHYSWNFRGTDQAAYYVRGDGVFPIGDSGFAALAHVGYSFGEYWSDVDRKYHDWAVGVQKSFAGFKFQLKYIDGSDLPDGPSDIFSTDGKVWASISTTLPWAAD